MNMPTELHEITNAVALEAEKTFGSRLERVLLYGSYARGDYDEQSDVDIMVIVNAVPEEINALSKPIRKLCGELLYEHGVVVSVCVQDGATWRRFAEALPFFRNVRGEGIGIA